MVGVGATATDPRRGPGSSAADAGTRTPTDSVAAVLALLVCLGFYVYQLAAFPTADDPDAAIHAIISAPPVRPAALLGAFARPLFATLYVLPGHWGYPGLRVLTVIVCGAAGWLTYRTAARLQLPYPWVAIPLVMLQPALYQLGTDAMTEPTFALVLAAGALAYSAGRSRLAAVTWSFLPLARPEGPMVLAVIAVMWLPRLIKDPTVWQALVLLATGTVVWFIACYVVTGDLWYIQHTFPWSASSSGIHGPVWYYVVRWPRIVGFSALVLSLMGLPVTWRQPVLRLALLATLAVFALHSYMWAAGRFASYGLDRYFATMAPFTALIATAGAGRLTKLSAIHRRAAVGALVGLQAVQAFGFVDSNSENFKGAVTYDLAMAAKNREGIAGRQIIAADQFGYVFTGYRPDSGPPFGDSTADMQYMRARPAGTLALWDDENGYWWFHLTVEQVERSGYQLAWERKAQVASPHARVYGWLRHHGATAWLYDLLGWTAPRRAMRVALLVRQAAG